MSLTNQSVLRRSASAVGAGVGCHSESADSHERIKTPSRTFVRGRCIVRGEPAVTRRHYLDAFVPTHGQSLLDLLSPERRRALEEFAKSEGEGWLVPRFAPLPWEHIVRNLWGIQDAADVRWMLDRLGATPLGHFTQSVQLTNAASATVPRTYVRCLQFKQERFDEHAATARRTPNWRYREIRTPHLPPITHPRELTELLLELT